jgi:hypothetical protein
MNDDPLAGFRRKGDNAKSPVPRTSDRSGSREYQAFNPKNNQRHGRLNIRRKGGMSHAPGYNFIIDICYDEDHYSGILLILSTMLVKIRGRNLRPIVERFLALANAFRSSATTSSTSPATRQPLSSRRLRS